MNSEQKFIEIPFGANDSELKGWEYTIPEGMEAIVKDGNVIVREKENEDERIRKELIEFIKWSVDRHFMREDFHQAKRPSEWIAYLEKQKEQKVDIDKLRRDIYQSGYNDGYQHGKEDAQKEQKPGEDSEYRKAYLDGWNARNLQATREQKPNIELIQRSWYMEGYTDGEFKREPMWNLATGKGGPRYEKNEKYGQPLEQKPAEWSEEDELMRKRCIVDLGYLTEYEPQYKERYDAQINWLKSLRPKCVNVSDQTLQLLICYLYACHDVAKRDWEKADCRRYISYLEDLDYTLKNRWKPSEEQMETLLGAEGVLRNLQYNDWAKILAELYEQLKQL